MRQNISSMAIRLKIVSIEAHNSIGKVKVAHKALRRAVEVLSHDLPKGKPDDILQMGVKAINDTSGPDGLVPSLLVFGAYPRNTEASAPAYSIYQRAEAVKKAMTEIRQIQAQNDIKRALATRNGPNTSHLDHVPIGGEILVYREKNNGELAGWKGPYILMAKEGETIRVRNPRTNRVFRVQEHHMLSLLPRHKSRPRMTTR